MFYFVLWNVAALDVYTGVSTARIDVEFKVGIITLNILVCKYVLRPYRLRSNMHVQSRGDSSARQL